MNKIKTRAEQKKEAIMGDKQFDLEIQLDSNVFGRSSLTSRSPVTASTPFNFEADTAVGNLLGAITQSTSPPTNTAAEHLLGATAPPKTPPPITSMTGILPTQIPFDDADDSRVFDPCNQTLNLISNATSRGAIPKQYNPTPSRNQSKPIPASRPHFTKDIRTNKRVSINEPPYQSVRSTNFVMLGNTISEIQDMRDPITPKFTRPPRFDPSKTNPVDFLKDYAVAARANSWNDVLQLCYFVNSLENSAAVWFRNFAKRNPNATWSETLKGFKSKFIGPNYEDDLNLRLLNRRQSANESLVEYFYAIIDLCDEVDSEMPDASIMRRLTAGMLPYYRHMINISRPNTLSDYERVVDSISETEREGSLYSTEKLKPQPSHKEHSQDVQELLKNMTQEIKSLVLFEVNSTLRTRLYLKLEFGQHIAGYILTNKRRAQSFTDAYLSLITSFYPHTSKTLDGCLRKSLIIY
ncbi:Retrotransposon gag protein [Popillia japonica]|uniref:Retrotransposon gag protein n=1 Tax=Popillia japonica TaxID=7064 RepID=A0AAW1JGI9_POPJA